MILLQMTLTNPDIWPNLSHLRFIGMLIGNLIGASSTFTQFKLFDFYSQTLINERTYDSNKF